MIVQIHLKEHVILLLDNVPVNLVLLEKIAVFQVHNIYIFFQSTICFEPLIYGSLKTSLAYGQSIKTIHMEPTIF